MRILFLHGWPLDETMWAPQLRVVEEVGLEPAAARLYGRGASIDGWATQLLREVEGPFVAVGASMGGYCALALARRSPERVVGIALVGSRAAADSPERRAGREEIIRVLRAGRLPDGVESPVAPEELAVAQEAMRDRPDLSDVASSFGGPLLVCVGGADEIVPVEEARELADSALAGSFVLFEGAGHLLSVEQPERFNDVLGEFVERWRT